MEPFKEQTINDKRKDSTTTLFNKLKNPIQLNMLRFFLDERKILPGADDELIELPLIFLFPNKLYR